LTSPIKIKVRGTLDSKVIVQEKKVIPIVTRNSTSLSCNDLETLNPGTLALEDLFCNSVVLTNGHGYMVFGDREILTPA